MKIGQFELKGMKKPNFAGNDQNWSFCIGNCTIRPTYNFHVKKPILFWP